MRAHDEIPDIYIHIYTERKTEVILTLKRYIYAKAVYVFVDAYA